MKKIVSLVLALCMSLAAIPALAEDFTGTWYLLMLGMTVGTLELNEDGTAALEVNADAADIREEGVWTAEENSIALTADGQTLVLTYDETGLKLDATGLEAIGLSADSVGMDASMIDSLLRISREPAAISLDAFSAYMNDGTLPEGKTEEDMEASQAEFISFLSGMMGGTDPTMLFDLGGDAEEGPELTVLEENFYVRSYYDDLLEGCYVAKVQNQNDVPLYISDATLVLKDADGNDVGEMNFIGKSGSRYLEPGEISYVFVSADVEEGKTPEAYAIRFQTSANSYETDTPLEIAGVELRKVEEYGWITYYAAATVTNHTDAPLSQANVVVAVRSADGKLLDLVNSGLYQNELAAGSTITLVDSLDSSTVDYCTENGIELGETEVSGWLDNMD